MMSNLPFSMKDRVHVHVHASSCCATACGILDRSIWEGIAASLYCSFVGSHFYSS